MSKGWFTPARKLMVLVAVAFLANMSVVGVVAQYAVRNGDAIAEIEEARAEARLTSCEQDNLGRLADQRSILALTTPQGLAQAEQDPASVRVALDFLGAIRPQRVCTPAGIDAFYASGGAEGVVPLDLPSHVAEFLARHE